MKMSCVDIGERRIWVLTGLSVFQFVTPSSGETCVVGWQDWARDDGEINV